MHKLRTTEETPEVDGRIIIPLQATVVICFPTVSDIDIDVAWADDKEPVTPEFLEVLKHIIVQKLPEKRKYSIEVISEIKLNGRLYHSHNNYRKKGSGWTG